MNQVHCCTSSRYFCECQGVYISANLLSDHLQLPYNHKIYKVNPEKPSSEYFNKSILNKIDSIFKIKTQIQKSSNNLTQAIMINTTIAMNKLDNLVRLYRNILSNPPHNLVLQNTEIVSTFYVDKSINQALINHFELKIIAEKFTVYRKMEMANSKILELFTKKSDVFWCMALFNNEKFIVTGGMDGFIRIWDTKSNTQCYFFKKHRSWVLSVAVGSRDEILLSGSADCSVRLWDLKSMKHICKFEGHSYAIRYVLISKNNKIGIIGSNDISIMCWNLEKKEIKYTLSALSINSMIRLFDDEKMLAGAGSNGLIFWTLSNKSYKIITDKEIKAICFSNDERYFITGNSTGLIQIWVLKTLKVIFEDKKHNGEINNIAISDDLLYFATCSSDNRVIVWNFKEKNILYNLNNDFSILSVLFLKNSENLVINNSSPQLNYFNLKHNLNEKRINIKPLEYRKIALSRDLGLMAYGYSSLVLFNLEKGTQLAKKKYMSSKCSILKFSQDKKYLGSGFISGEVIIFKIPSLTQVYKLNLGKSTVKCLTFSKDNKFVGINFEECTMFVQSIENKEVVYKELDKKVKSIAFCLNSKKFVYTISKSIFILDEYYKKIAVLEIKIPASYLFLREDKIVIISDDYSNFSGINISNCKMLFDNKRKRDLKKWSAKDPKFRLFLLFPAIQQC